MTVEASFTYVDLPAQRVAADNAIEYAYRDLGASDAPLVLLQHFRGNLDNWDPALIDALAADRRVITFDNTGVGATTGRTPNTIEAMAHDAIAFLEAIELERVDLLGFSIGSFVAQEIALIRPDLLRRIVLASSAPQGAAGMHGWAPEVIGAVGAPETNPEGYLDVFFAPTDTSRDAGRQAAGRIFGQDSQPRRADDLADPAGAVRRRLRLGDPESRPTAASRRDRAARVRRQRRQRPDDPSPLLAPARRAAPERAGHDLPGLGARLSLPALRRVRSRRPRLPRGAQLMPMIDVYAAADTFADKRTLAQDLAAAVMRWEQVPELPLFANNTAAFIHDLDAGAISNVAGDNNYVRVQVLTPIGVLDREKQLGVVKELTEIVAEAAGDPSVAERTWVLLTESPEGGWGIAGHANTNADIAALARAALAGDEPPVAG